MIKPGIPRGMRDFSPSEVFQREYIFNTIKEVYRDFGYLPVETPSMENMSTLTGKYGEEGDKLLFKVLNSGEYLKDVNDEVLNSRDYKKLSSAISEKGLRYDLTVPLARFVTMHRNELVLPFKRYQIQLVWRADRPQKGRYREFYQCDADVIGSYSLIFDAECIAMFDEVFGKLAIPSMKLKLNNRKLLYGITEQLNITDKFIDFTIAIDKLDKVGFEGVEEELLKRGFEQGQIARITSLFNIEGSNRDKLAYYRGQLADSGSAQKGLEELEKLLDLAEAITLGSILVEFDITLARGLNYYTSTIFEAVTDAVKIGSLGSGGRYDDLTSAFGMPDMPGVGISFGADRIYDVLNELNLFPVIEAINPKVLLINFGGEEEVFSFKILQLLRHENIIAELFPTPGKIAKQFKYADKKMIPFVITIGSEERLNGKFTVKNLSTGEQQVLEIKEIIELLKKDNIQ